MGREFQQPVVTSSFFMTCAYSTSHGTVTSANFPPFFTFLRSARSPIKSRVGCFMCVTSLSPLHFRRAILRAIRHFVRFVAPANETTTITMARRKLKSAARGRSAVEGKKRETVVASVPRLKTSEENGGDENLGSSTAARTQTDHRTSPRIHSQNLLGGDLKSPPEDIVSINSGSHLAVHQNATTKTA